MQNCSQMEHIVFRSWCELCTGLDMTFRKIQIMARCVGLLHTAVYTLYDTPVIEGITCFSKFSESVLNCKFVGQQKIIYSSLKLGNSYGLSPLVLSKLFCDLFANNNVSKRNLSRMLHLKRSFYLGIHTTNLQIIRLRYEHWLNLCQSNQTMLDSWIHGSARFRHESECWWYVKYSTKSFEHTHNTDLINSTKFSWCSKKVL